MPSAHAQLAFCHVTLRPLNQLDACDALLSPSLCKCRRPCIVREPDLHMRSVSIVSALRAGHCSLQCSKLRKPTAYISHVPATPQRSIATAALAERIGSNEQAATLKGDTQVTVHGAPCCFDKANEPAVQRFEHYFMQAAYVHLPFCKRKCFYCDFPVVATGSRVESREVHDSIQVRQHLRCVHVTSSSLLHCSIDLW